MEFASGERYVNPRTGHRRRSTEWKLPVDNKHTLTVTKEDDFCIPTIGLEDMPTTNIAVAADGGYYGSFSLGPNLANEISIRPTTGSSFVKTLTPKRFLEIVNVSNAAELAEYLKSALPTAATHTTIKRYAIFSKPTGEAAISAAVKIVHDSEDTTLTRTVNCSQRDLFDYKATLPPTTHKVPWFHQ